MALVLAGRRRRSSTAQLTIDAVRIGRAAGVEVAGTLGARGGEGRHRCMRWSPPARPRSAPCTCAAVSTLVVDRRPRPDHRPGTGCSSPSGCRRRRASSRRRPGSWSTVGAHLRAVDVERHAGGHPGWPRRDATARRCTGPVAVTRVEGEPVVDTEEDQRAGVGAGRRACRSCRWRRSGRHHRSRSACRRWSWSSRTRPARC